MRTTRWIRLIAVGTATALTAGIALLSPASSAQAAQAPEFTGTTGFPTKVTAGISGKTHAFLVNFTGPAPDSETSYVASSKAGKGPTVALIDTRGKPSALPQVTTDTAASLSPGTPVRYSLNVPAYATPGRYTVTIPAQLRVYDSATGTTTSTEFSTTLAVTVTAEPFTTMMQSRLRLRGKLTRTSRWKITFSGPSYTRGATFRVYFKAKGKKKYSKIGSKKVNSHGTASLRLKAGAIRPSGKLTIALSSVPYAPGWRSYVGKFAKR